MKQKLLSFFLAAIGLVVGANQGMAEDDISCSAYLSSTAGTPTVTNCTLSVNFNSSSVPSGTNLAGTDYYYAKMNNDANYYKVTLNQTVGETTYDKFKAGDQVVVYLYSNGSTVAYKVGSSSMTECKLENQTTSSIIEISHTLTANEIEDDGSIQIYRSSSNTYFAGISISGTRVIYNLEDNDLVLTSQSNINLAVGSTSTIEYSTSSNGTVTFVSSNTNVAEVSNNGVITAKSGGIATITVNQAESSEYESGTKTITVIVPYSLTLADSYNIDSSTYGFSDASYNYYFNNGFWISNSNNKGYGSGSTTSFENSMKFSAGVTYTIHIPEGTSIYYAIVKAKSNYTTTDPKAYWGTLFGNDYTNEELPCSDENGFSQKIVEFESAQTGTLTFTPKGNQVLMAIELSAVSKLPSDFAITTPQTLNVKFDEAGETADIVYSTSATDATILFQSSNENVATVDANGRITAVAIGTCTITVTQSGSETHANDSKTINVQVGDARTFVDFDIDFRVKASETVPYTITLPTSGTLPNGVTVNSGSYNGSQHGAQNPTIKVPVDGPVEFTIGSCQYGSHTVTITDETNTELAVIDNNNGCEKAVSSISSATYNNYVTYNYMGTDAKTLTFVVNGYLPFFKAKACEQKQIFTVTFMNGNTQVSQKEVYEDDGIGTLPTPEYDSDSQYFVGWYSDADDMGTKAFASTVPTGDATYYAVFIDAPTATAGYYTPTTAAELIGTINYANANASQNNPVKIFLKNGTYDLGSAAEITQLTGSYISLIGESLEGTIITNIPELEGLGTATLLTNKGDYNYLQDLTLHNNYPYGNSTGRAASLKDEGNYTICKNVWLYSHQDTYYSHKSGGYFYFNGGKISGCVDYMCGQSRVYFDGVTLSNDNKTSYMTANSELYVFNNCIVENNGSNTYYFGRSWGSVNNGPHCVFLNTTLKDNGSHLGTTRWLASGMNDPYVTAGEYGTKDANGTNITPSSNIVNFTSDAGNATLETILTQAEAAEYTLSTTLGAWGEDATEQAQQATVSNVKLDGTTLSWTGTSDAYLIEKDGEFVALTTGTSYTVDNALAAYTVRAANSRGGFGEAETSAVVVTFTISTGTEATSLVSMGTCNLSAIYSFMHILATKADGENTGKQDLSVKLQCKTAETEAAEVQFYVPEGFKFVPYSASVKVQPVGNDAYVKLELSDTGAGTTKISGSAEPLPAGEITTVTLDLTEKYELESGVSLKLYCYDGGSTGVTQFRLGTPMTITGMLQPDVLTLTTTYNMEGYKAFYPGWANYIADENTDVYIAKSVGEDKVVLKRIENRFIPTQTAVILKTTGVADEPTENAYYQMTLTRSTYIDNDVTDNLLHVTMGNGWEDFTNGVYRLGYKAGQGVGFYTWKDPSPDEGIIYISKPTSGNAKLTIVFQGEEEEEATGVNVVNEDDENAPADTYNPLGQRVDANAKGLVITKGKKYVK